ncbi:hypothetical protein AHAS_Ahas02G0170400 [Arachis hypogaea]
MKTEVIIEHWFGEEAERSDRSGGQCGHGDDKAEEEGDDNDDDGGDEGLFCPMLELSGTILSSVRVDGVTDLSD